MEVNYVHKDTLTATEYVELNKNNELPISYNQVLLKENQELKSIINQIGFEPDEIAFLQQENAELKKQLEVGEEQYNNLVQEKEELQEQLAIKTLELENRKTGYIRSLNNQLLEDIEPDPEDFYLAEIEVKANDYDKLLIKQKEFIKYLKDEIQQQETVIAENQEKSYFLIYEDEKEYLKLSSRRAYIRRIILEEVLQKYKSIIGVSDEKEN